MSIPRPTSTATGPAARVPPVPPAPPAGPLPRAERHRAILAGAASAFAERGYAATSMEQIAAASGITKLIVYRHFDSKEELYRAVLQKVFDRLADEFLRGFAAGAEGTSARAMLRTARADPDGFRLLWRHAAREPEFAEYARELREHAVDASRAMVTPHVDPTLREWAAHTMVGYVVEATLAWLDHGDPERDEEFVELTTAAARVAVGTWGQARAGTDSGAG